MSPDTTRLEQIEAILLTQAGRLDLLTAQVAKLGTYVEDLAVHVEQLRTQVDRFVEQVILGFTQRDARGRRTDDLLQRIARKLDEFERILTPSLLARDELWGDEAFRREFLEAARRVARETLERLGKTPVD